MGAAALLVESHHAVFARTAEWFAELGPDDLGRIVVRRWDPR